MDSLNEYRQIIRNIITEYAKLRYAHGEIERQAVLDQEADHYLLMILGQEGTKHVHGCLIHIDIIDGKIWIQRDGTEDGVAGNLLTAGVTKDKIVLGFRSLEMCSLTELAVS